MFIKRKGGYEDEEILGKKFGKLTPIKAVSGNHKHKVWECKCDCGGSIDALATKFVRGYIKTCGCESKKWKGYKEIPGSFWNDIKQGAKIRNYELAISIEYAWEIYVKQDKKCALSGVPLFFNTVRNPVGMHRKDVEHVPPIKNERTASLDRINSDMGYVEGNVQWVHKSINMMKRDFNQQEFLDWCKKITDYLTIGEKE